MQKFDKQKSFIAKCGAMVISFINFFFKKKFNDNKKDKKEHNKPDDIYPLW